jgi:hypothetical protein
MRIAVHGIGCVGPLGGDWDAARRRLASGVRPAATLLSGPPGHPAHPVLGVPPPFEFPHPRLRRSSPISHFACAAASEAVARSGRDLSGRTALVMASTDGAVIYTRRFFSEVLKSGSGSPMLFPETVYNAPASHVAAVLGLDGTVLTMVGDATAGTDALATAAELLAGGDADRCLVVASEEADWISCDGYRRWGLADTPLSEGAVAMLVGPAAPDGPAITAIHPGRTLRRPVADSIARVLAETAAGACPDAAVLSAPGGTLGKSERRAVERLFPGIRVSVPKEVAGEAFAVSALLQCALAWQDVRDGSSACTLVSAVGSGGQIGSVLASAPAVRM